MSFSKQQSSIERTVDSFNDKQQIFIELQDLDNTNKNQSNSLKLDIEKRVSFKNLQQDNQIKLQKLIRNQIETCMKGKLKHKMSLQINQTCICTSDIYTKSGDYWNNREISQLTTNRFDSIPIGKIAKIKVLGQQPISGYHLFRVKTKDKDVKDFAIRAIDVPLWFSNCIWVYLVSLGHNINLVREFDGVISGQILKKSQFLGNWQARNVQISTKDHTFSFSDKNKVTSIKIQKGSQIWTHFQVIQHKGNKYMVIKTWHMMFKYEFGIPLNEIVKWAKAFCVLVK